MSDGSPHHAHIYYAESERSVASALRDRFAGLASAADPRILFVGRMTDRGVGPHPLPQFEVHFLEDSMALVIGMIEETGLVALVHPLTDDDVADHTSLAHWIGEPLDLDLGALDPPGANQAIPRFGNSDF